MRKNANIQIKGYYTCKVTNKEVTIQILASSPKGGWEAVNTKTGKTIHIKSPERLIKKVAAPKAKAAKKTPAEKAPAKEPTKPAGKSKLTKQPKADKKANSAEKQAADETPKTAKKLSLVGAAIQILEKSKEPLSCKDIIEQVTHQQLWKPTKGGKTPANTLYAAFLREIKTKGKDARFSKSAPGKFALSK